MPLFSYHASDADQKPVTGTVEAPTLPLAVKVLRNRQYFIIDIKERTLGVLSLLFLRFRKVSASDITNFTRQLATMVVAGLSLPDALTILRTQATNPVLTKALTDVENQILSGGNLAASLSKHPTIFSTVYRSLVKAGETSGTLDQVLLRLAETLETEREFASKVKGALIYPAIVIVGMIVVVFVMMTVVIPKLTELYKDFGIALPLTTQLLINISNLFVLYWWLALVFIVVGAAVFKKWSKTTVGEFIVDSVKLRIPIMGDLQKKIILVEFTRTLAMLIGSGIHILNGLSILRDSLGNVLFRRAIDDISKRIEKGFSLGETFAQHPIFPPIVPQMMKVGEETGKLDDTLFKLSKYFQTESEHLVRGLTTAIEPIIMVVLGLGVGFIVISIVTPIYSLTTQLK